MLVREIVISIGVLERLLWDKAIRLGRVKELLFLGLVACGVERL